jgi:hypothetical protein
MKKILLILILLINLSFAFSQTNICYNVDLNDRTKTKISILKIFGKEWEILDFVIGDLNLDNRKDLLVVLNNKTNSDDNRKIILLVNLSKDTFEIKGINQNIVDCGNCGGGGIGEPYRKSVIKNGYFSIEQLYGGCDKAYIITTFKYNLKMKDWYLHKETIENYSCIQETNGDEIKSTIQENKKEFYKKLTFKNY